MIYTEVIERNVQSRQVMSTKVLAKVYILSKVNIFYLCHFTEQINIKINILNIITITWNWYAQEGDTVMLPCDIRDGYPQISLAV
jgi:hypothetical protein